MTAPQQPPQVAYVPGVGVCVQTDQGDWTVVEADGSVRSNLEPDLDQFLGVVELMPATMSPSNPEHLRKSAVLLGRIEGGDRNGIYQQLVDVQRWLRATADRLDRVQAEVKQDLADRRCADEIVAALTRPPNLRECPTAEHSAVMFEAALAGIRSERERTGKSGAS